MMRVQGAALGLAACLTAAGARTEENALFLSLKARERVLEAGQPLHLSIAIENRGDEAVFFRRPFDLGPGAIEVFARSGVCETAAETMRFTVVLPDARLRFASLLPGEILEMDLPTLDDARETGGAFLPLDGSGRYSLRGEVTLQPSVEADPVQGAWAGRLVSPEVPLVVGPARESETARQREVLRACVQADCDHELGVLNYFRLVRDDGAAQLLARMAERVNDNAWLVNAIVFQGRAQDRKVLETMGRRAKDDEWRRTLERRATEIGRTCRGVS